MYSRIFLAPSCCRAHVSAAFMSLCPIPSRRADSATDIFQMLNSGTDRVTPVQSMWPLVCSEVGLSYEQEERLRTYQRLTLQNGRAPASDFTPQPASGDCAWGYKDGAGGALYLRDGVLSADRTPNAEGVRRLGAGEFTAESLRGAGGAGGGGDLPRGPARPQGRGPGPGGRGQSCVAGV